MEAKHYVSNYTYKISLVILENRFGGKDFQTDTMYIPFFYVLFDNRTPYGDIILFYVNENIRTITYPCYYCVQIEFIDHHHFFWVCIQGHHFFWGGGRRYAFTHPLVFKKFWVLPYLGQICTKQAGSETNMAPIGPVLTKMERFWSKWAGIGL